MTQMLFWELQLSRIKHAQLSSKQMVKLWLKKRTLDMAG
jgi:hypothetical protein